MTVWFPPLIATSAGHLVDLAHDLPSCSPNGRAPSPVTTWPGSVCPESGSLRLLSARSMCLWPGVEPIHSPARGIRRGRSWHIAFFSESGSRRQDFGVGWQEARPDFG